MSIDARLSALRREAVALAGRPADLAQRASVYHHLYRVSGGNHVFPLIAAHGALWAGGYFRRHLAWGERAARVAGGLAGGGAARAAMLHALADAFRDINRRVCVESWFLYHLTADPALDGAASRLVPPGLCEQLRACHAARVSGQALAPAARRALFGAFFAWEQAEIVGPSVTSAFAALDWPLARWVALRPRIAFAYLDAPLPFHDFADAAERVEKGFAAYDAGVQVGWDRVERSLDDYRIMPTGYVDRAEHFFGAVRHHVALA